MIPALGWTALTLAVGFTLARVVDRKQRWEDSLALSILLGMAAQACVLFVMGVCGIPWSRFGLVAGLAIIAAAALGVRRPARDDSPPAPQGSSTGLSLAIDCVAIALLGGYAVFCIVSVGGENDFIGIWGVKARVFFEAGGLDWTFLSLPVNDYVHPDYPLLLPLIFSSVAVMAGVWDERALGLINPVAALAAILAVRAELRRQSATAVLTSIGTLSLVSWTLSPWIGLAEGPLLAYCTVGLLLARTALREGTSLAPAALLLALAASVKNEGLSMLVACAASATLFAGGARWRTLLGFWPAVVVLLPWSALRAAKGLDSYFVRGAFVDRALSAIDFERILSVGRLIAAHTPTDAVFVIGVGLAILAGWRRIASERFLLSAVAIQVSFFVGAYLISPFSLDWHIQWSWERLLSQVALPLVFVLVVMLLSAFEPREIGGKGDGSPGSASAGG